jgi:hypothetical protein
MSVMAGEFALIRARLSHPRPQPRRDNITQPHRAVFHYHGDPVADDCSRKEIEFGLSFDRGDTEPSQ